MSDNQCVTCPNCGFDLTTPALLRVKLRRWNAAGAAPYLQGAFADLQKLVAQGYAARDAAGWYRPTDKFNA